MKKALIFIVSVAALFFLFNNVLMPLYVKHSDTVKVPKVTGMNYIEAKKLIEEAGLEIKQGDVKYDENIPIGMILDQNPPSEETVKYGRRIYVTMSGGEQLAEVPNLKGRSLRDAKFSLEQRGLKLGETVRKNTNEYPADVVISQIIQPGSKVKKNSSLDLILSDGPLAGDLKIPGLTGKTLEEAKKIISDSKLKLGKITYQTNNDIPPGQIVDQYPKFDKSANENTAVDLFVSRKKVIVKKDTEESETGETGTDKQQSTDKETNKSAETPKDKSKDKPKEDQTNTPPEKKIEKKSPVPSDKKEEIQKIKPDIKKDGGTDNDKK
ncbi:MAG: PASTA domain-containing protein [Bacteroidetes bacterium]|nr:PASTA domain-containing protein [Bacteroidota bacterium]